MALQVNLTLSKTYFLPGEVVQVSVQICNDADSASADGQQGASSPQIIHIKELSFQACGSERTDPAFIHRLYRPDVPVEAVDSRRQTRSIFSTDPAVLVSDRVLAQHAVQHFRLRFRLPPALPPSFRGSAVRFLYLIQVKAVYEVHRGDLDAVVYETTASTSLVVWPGGAGLPSGAAAGAAADRRSSTLESATSGAAAAAAHLQMEASRGSTAGGGGGGSYARMGSVGGAVPASPPAMGMGHAASLTSPLPAGAGGGGGGVGGGGGDEADVAMCEYTLGRNNCRIRWQEVCCADPSSPDGGPHSNSDAPHHHPGHEPGSGTPGGGGGTPGGGGNGQLVSVSSGFGSALQQPAPHALRGVIPFGINHPFTPPYANNPALSLLPFPDSDGEEHAAADSGGGAASARGPLPQLSAAAASRLPKTLASSFAAAVRPAAHVQRQLSTGAAGAAGAVGLGPFARVPSRRGSLFGKVYAINVGEQPLLRLLLQAPLEVPLQPGATFGGVLDFRPPLLVAAAAAASSAGGGGGAICCHDVVVLLESEELVASECRPAPQMGMGHAASLPAGVGGGRGGVGGGGGDEADVAICEYTLERNNCRIRWQDPVAGSGVLRGPEQPRRRAAQQQRRAAPPPGARARLWHPRRRRWRRRPPRGRGRG